MQGADSRVHGREKEQGRDGPDGLRRWLQRQTAALHDQTERRVLGAASVQDITRPAYDALLVSALRAHVLLGRAAAPFLGAGACAREDLRIAALCADLGRDGDLDGMVPVLAPGRDWAWGVGYALKGSAIGARSLLEAAATRGWPVAYLGAQRRFATSGELSRFLRALDRCGARPDAALGGARGVFAMYDAAGKGPGQCPFS